MYNPKHKWIFSDESLDNFRNKSNVRYFVGGYWRRFTSNFYKHMQGKKIWVKSFYRNMDADEESIPKFINITKAKK